MTRKRSFFTAAAASAVLLGLIGSAIAAPTAPDSLSGLSAWFRAEDITGVADGGAVGTWTDKAAGIVASQTNSALFPIYYSDAAGTGMPGLRFSGDNLSAGDVELHGTGGMTVIAMTQPENMGYIASKFAYTADGRAWRIRPDAWDLQEIPTSWDANNYISALPSAYYQSPMVTAGRWTPAVSSELWCNGTLLGSAPVPAATMPDTASVVMIGNQQAGGTQAFSGFINELIIFNRALSDTEMAGVQEYLEEKYQWTPPEPPVPTVPQFYADVNFQSASASLTLPPGWVADTGGTYSAKNGLTYGWSRDMSAYAQNPQPGQLPADRPFTDPLLDSMVYTSASGDMAVWEMEVPNGRYWVRALFSEPRVDFTPGAQTVQIEGVSFNDPAPYNAPTQTSRYVEHYGQVEVTDGKLTVNSPMFQIGENLQTGEPIFGSLNSKLAAVQVHEANVPDIAINFQTPTGLNMFGMMQDVGKAFGDRGNGYSYGWVDDFGSPIGVESGMRWRTTNISVPGLPADPRWATLSHMTGHRWEIELPNGEYSVLAVLGEPDVASTSTNMLDIEGISFNDPDLNQNWRGEADLYMTRVNVTDGRLTLDDLNTTSSCKLMYVEITSVGATVVPEPAMLALLGALCGAAAMRRRRS